MKEAISAHTHYPIYTPILYRRYGHRGTLPDPLSRRRLWKRERQTEKNIATCGLIVSVVCCTWKWKLIAVSPRVIRAVGGGCEYENELALVYIHLTSWSWSSSYWWCFSVYIFLQTPPPPPPPWVCMWVFVYAVGVKKNRGIALNNGVRGSALGNLATYFQSTACGRRRNVRYITLRWCTHSSSSSTAPTNQRHTTREE